ncbi:hypothetical protein STEG23_008875, partial [Scotinomys teguina]
MEVVAAALRCQLLLILLMAAMLLLGMKGSPLLVRRKIARTIELQESTGELSVGHAYFCSTKNKALHMQKLQGREPRKMEEHKAA